MPVKAGSSSPYTFVASATVMVTDFAVMTKFVGTESFQAPMPLTTIA